MCVPATWTKVMETKSKQKTPSHLAWSESLYLGRRKPLLVSQNYVQSRDNHFQFDENHKTAIWTCRSTIQKPLDGRKLLPVTCDVDYSLPIELEGKKDGNLWTRMRGATRWATHTTDFLPCRITIVARTGRGIEQFLTKVADRDRNVKVKMWVVLK